MKGEKFIRLPHFWMAAPRWRSAAERRWRAGCRRLVRRSRWPRGQWKHGLSPLVAAFLAGLQICFKGMATPEAALAGLGLHGLEAAPQSTLSVPDAPLNAVLEVVVPGMTVLTGAVGCAG